MYRVYDHKEKQWVNENILLSSHNDLYEVHRHKLKLLSERRYTYQIDIGIYDKNHKLIFEGDIAESDDGKIGLISYAPENASYVFLDYDENKYYPLGVKICSNFLKVIGNLFDTPELIPDTTQEEQTE